MYTLSVSGMKEREPAPKTVCGEGAWGVDREAAFEFVFYYLTSLKKKKILREQNVLTLTKKTEVLIDAVS